MTHVTSATVGKSMSITRNFIKLGGAQMAKIAQELIVGIFIVIM